jgi:hypothetical protein
MALSKNVAQFMAILAGKYDDLGVAKKMWSWHRLPIRSLIQVVNEVARADQIWPSLCNLRFTH